MKLLYTLILCGFNFVVADTWLPLTFYQPRRETAEMSRIILTDVIAKVLKEKFLTSLKACFPKLNIDVVREDIIEKIMDYEIDN
jgi:hypothetical protein